MPKKKPKPAPDASPIDVAGSIDDAEKATLPMRAKPEAKGAGASKPAAEARHRWTFLTNHSHVLILLNAEPDLVLREIAARVGITERAIQQILADLESEGFVEREKVGRRNHYRVITDHYLRHPIEAHCKVADLLSLIVNHPDAKNNELL